MVTDGIEMAAIADTFGIAEGTVLALAAGVDAVCVGGGLRDEADYLMPAGRAGGAVREGRLPGRAAARRGHARARSSARGPPRSVRMWRGRTLPAAGSGRSGAVPANGAGAFCRRLCVVESARAARTVRTGADGASAEAAGPSSTPTATSVATTGTGVGVGGIGWCADDRPDRRVARAHRLRRPASCR